MKNKSLMRLLLIFIVGSVLASRLSIAQNQVRNYEIDDLIKVIRISDRVIVVRTGVTYFEAVTAIATQKGIVLIDAGNTLQLTEKYKKIIIKELGRDDFIYLINTHSHRDHTGGNQVFPAATIIGHEKTKEAMIREWNDKEFYSEILRNGIKEGTERLKNMDINTEAGKQAYYELTKNLMVQSDVGPGNNHVTTVPAITFTDNLTLALGDITVELMYFGNAHSEGDTWVYIPEEKLLFNGDVFFRNGVPNLTYFATEETSGIGEVKRWQKVLSYLLRPDRPVETIVRGHGDIMNFNDLKNFSQYIAGIWNEFEKGKEIYPLSRMGKVLEKEGVDAARAEFQKLRTVDKDKYFFLERGFNVMGNKFLSPNKTAEAIELCKMNVELFPQSANAYERLAETYMKVGNKELAIKNYEKSLELNPQNTTASEQIKKLREKNQEEK
ncbi:MAG: MBL fold metallo-hydrolase [Chrysiogenales bacterium]